MKRRSESSNGEPEATKRKKDEGKEGGVRCGMEFYDRSCEELAVAMLGCVLVCRDEDGEECRGEIVEVEAYLGGEDRAAHSFNGRRSAANEAMFMVSLNITIFGQIISPSHQALPTSIPYMEYTLVSMYPVEEKELQC